jgi:hypothetical protein
MENTLIKQEPPTATTPAHLIELAITKDLDVEKLGKLMEMNRQFQADQARKAFFAAIGKFQAEVPELRKSKKVSFTTNSGKTEYNYAPLSDIARQIKDTCQKCELTYRWEIQDTEKEIKVTCLVTHSEGHTEQTTMTANPDNSGGKQAIQARGSAIEYLKRYTLIGALGLTTTDSDVDGVTPEIDMDVLHAQFMKLYNKLIQIDSKLSRIHPDNWKGEKTTRVYLKAIGEARKMLVDLTPKEV